MNNNRQTCITEMWDEILKFNEKYFPSWRSSDPVYYSNALAGEVGEVCNAIKHMLDGGTNKKAVFDYDLLMELADVFIYMELLIELRGHDISTFANVIEDKLKENILRMESRDDQI